MAFPDFPETNTQSLVVDFGHIVSLPIDYLEDVALSRMALMLNTADLMAPSPAIAFAFGISVPPEGVSQAQQSFSDVGRIFCGFYGVDDLLKTERLRDF